MYLTPLVVLAAETRAVAVSWDVALGAGSLILLTGGLTAVIRRAMRLGQALGVLALAIAVAGIAALASTFPSDFYRILIIGTTTLAGAGMAAAIVSRPLPRIR
jgi:hypothetical protein